MKAKRLKTMKVKMLKTLEPDNIPNGSIGEAFGNVNEPGLHLCLFDGFLAIVFRHEVELIENLGTPESFRRQLPPWPRKSADQAIAKGC